MAQEVSSTVSDSVREQIEAYLNAGYRLFKLTANRVPRWPGWRKSAQEPLQETLEMGPVWGVCLQADDLVLDVDPRRFKDGVNQLETLWEQLDLPRPISTYMVETRSGGVHIYFKKPPHVKMRARLPGFDAIECKSAGNYVVSAGSAILHDGETLRYETIRKTPNQVEAIPISLLAFGEREAAEVTSGEDFYDDSEANTARFKYEALRAEPAIQGQAGNNSTYRLACRGRDIGISEELVADIMAACFNPRCEPEWCEDELRSIVGHAYDYAQSSAGNASTVNVFSDFEIPAEKGPGLAGVPKPGNNERYEFSGGWDYLYIRTPDGLKVKVAPTLANTIRYFGLPKIRGDQVENPLVGLLKFNAHTRNIEFRKKAPWHDSYSDSKVWADTDGVELEAWMGFALQHNVDKSKIDKAAYVVARYSTYHPIKDWFAELKWDGKPRLDMMLTTYAGVVNNKYTREVSKNTMIAGIARVLDPGCQHDSMLVLEGPQDLGKSSFCMILGGGTIDQGGFHIDLKLDPDDKDLPAKMRRGWIVEISEMAFVKRADVEAIKRFITVKSDSVRLPYDKHPQDLPRNSILIGTINPQVDNGYLTDVTGNRRFWPVTCTKIDLQGLKRDRDQLWAEALVRYQQGEKWHIYDPALLALAKHEQGERLTTDIWCEVLNEYMQEYRSRPHEPQTLQEIAFHGLGISAFKLDSATTRRISGALRMLGFYPRDGRAGGARRRVWVKDLEL